MLEKLQADLFETGLEVQLFVKLAIQFIMALLLA